MTDLFDLMALQPHMGERFRGRLGEYRRISEGNYVIYFRPLVNGVQIHRVIPGARDHRELI